MLFGFVKIVNWFAYLYTFNILPARVYPFEQTFVGTLSVHLRYGVRFLTEKKTELNSKLRHFIKLTILEISFKCLYSIQNPNSHLIPSKPFQPLFYLKYDFLSFIAIHNCQAKIGFFHTKNIKFKTKCIAHLNGNSFL